MSLPPWVFDLDGTLADTKDLVLEAYKLAGYPMPKDAWGKPLHEWCPATDVERASTLKDAAYRSLIAFHGVQRLPCAYLAEALLDLSWQGPYVLTGASAGSVRAVLRAIDLDELTVLGDGCGRAEKIAALRNMSEPGIYVDDDLETCEAVASETEWRLAYVAEGASIEDVVGGVKDLWTP